MFFQNTNINIDQIIDKALNFIVPASDDTSIDDTAQVMHHLHQHFADPVYGLRTGYIISNQYSGDDSRNGSH